MLSGAVESDLCGSLICKERQGEQRNALRSMPGKCFASSLDSAALIRLGGPRFGVGLHFLAVKALGTIAMRL